MINWKYMVVFAGFAFVISILTGGLSGVSLLDIFIRAFIWGLLFAGIGAGVSFVASKYLPDIISNKEKTGPVDINEYESESEGDIDFIIPEENPHKKRVEEKTVYAKDTYNGLPEDNTDYDNATDSITDITDTDSLDEHYEAEYKEDSDDTPVLESAADTSETPELMGADEEDISEGMSEDMSDDSDSSADEISTDEIPDLDSLDGAFGKLSANADTEMETDYVDNSVSLDSSGKMGGEETINIGGVTGDPSQAAKAIKTWMKRDTEG
ncbi:MAG: hypothetical protein JW969_07185 [Spirochaetales bacterium]|nr:hypothetical protein [Spirochaetales bacterium]